MPSPNSLVRNGRVSLRGTITNDLWPGLFFFTSIAVMNSQLLTVLGLVLGLVIGFRTTSAYDRYWEGRKLWTSVSLSSRSLANIIWIHVPTDRSSVSDIPLPKDAKLKVIIEKKSMINLAQAFSVSVKLAPVVLPCLTTTSTLSRMRVYNSVVLPLHPDHLRIAIWLYLLFLPFQIYGAMKWYTIPATFFTTFLFLGFLEIGDQIENPFGYDPNDLDIDGYCLSIARELAEIMAQDPFPPSSYVFSDFNQPFAPADRRTASRLLTEPDGQEYLDEKSGMKNVHVTLVKSWSSVNEMTTHHQKNKTAAWTHGCICVICGME
ncbi:hypothetical protein BDV93DRAFT_558299 [Ceratobasidium sp. AG-I]|nr:hypothetical protein BDV93DRAFT_558299 [Ceratobasidium sp. AG-I]